MKIGQSGANDQPIRSVNEPNCLVRLVEVKMQPSSKISAIELANNYRNGATNPVLVVEAALALAKLSRGIFISLDAERALLSATASANRWREGKPLSALDGVPIAWKDLFDVAGLATTAGAAVFRNNAPAAHTAAIVDSAERAGMITVGKTNLSELAYSGLGLNPHFGTPTNAALDNGRRIPGGSSSGAAISVASNIVPISIGTDTAGSIRIPSAFNGLVGYRASQSRYPMKGVTPLSQTLDTLGPIANTVADCAAFDSVVRGTVNSAIQRSIHTQRFVVDPDLIGRYGVDQSVSRNFDQFVEALESNGACVEIRALNSLAKINALVRLRGWIGSLEAFDRYRSLLDSAESSQLDPRVKARLELMRGVPSERLGELLGSRKTLIAQFAQELSGATFLAPTVAHVAPLLEPLVEDSEFFASVNLRTLALTMPGSFLDAPTIAMPSGFDTDGLPTSVQLMRVQGDDDALLAVARSIEFLSHR